MYKIPSGFTFITFLGLFIVYLIGLIVPDIMEVDAAQYAAMSMEMAQTGSYLQIHHLGLNYLDKPPLIFWLGAISTKLFGINHFAYRLPNFLITIVGVYATYGLGKRLYNKNTGILSAILIASSQVYILHNQDVRTDTLLTNFVIIAIWQGYAYLQSRKASHFIWAFTAVGFAMLAKGPIGAIVPVMALGTHLLYKRDWVNLFNWRWILGIALVLLILAPMIWGLYLQFDSNPDVYVNGRTGVSGIRFFFWEQSFGRITGENVWKDDSSYFFFTHNYLWEFLPWSLIGIMAMFTKFKNLFANKFKFISTNEMLTMGGFIFPFIALSTSQYKLPHYIMVIMPMAAIFTAGYIDSILDSKNAKARNIFSIIQWVFSILIGFLVLFILYFIFPAEQALWWMVPLTLFFLGFILFRKEDRVVKLLGPSIVALVLTNIVMNGYFYPNLNEYQSGRKLADWAVENEISSDELVFFRKHYFNTYFYSKQNYKSVGFDTLQNFNTNKDVYVYTLDKGLKELKDKNVTYQVKKRFYNFPNAELTTEFLNPATRESSLENFYLIVIDQNN
jgi:4-amino-4-deoxy-L-arabinose transferase-like glycosyltransferase